MNSIANINFRRKHLRFITPSVPFAERRIIGMKKVAILLALFCMLTVTASAAYIPEDVISENRDGRQLIQMDGEEETCGT